MLFGGSCAENRIADFQKTEARADVLPAENRPKNIIFMIGDGMALAHTTALIYAQGNKSVLEQFPVIGYHKSYSFSDLVTDSAAGATAFSCGCKTYNNAVGLKSDTTRCLTIFEQLKPLGFAMGMATSCSASHATPAAFFAHQKLRTFYYEIAVDFLSTDIDCLVAGGEHYFTDRDDRRNLSKELEKKGYSVSRGLNLRRAPWESADRPIVFFTDDYEPPSALNQRRYLPESVSLTANFLQKRSKKGFFLMVEGSQIDWACHANDENWMVAELKDFEKAIINALEFAKKDGNTLVVVTGDHDGGGVSIERGSSMGNVNVKWGSKDHGGVLVPVFAWGPGAADFSGIYENTALHRKFLRALGI